MPDTAILLKQRAKGHVKLHVTPLGVAQLREEGAAKLRLPPGSHEAYLINTAGGLAGGDSFSYDFALAENSYLTITSQAAERVYHSLGPPASIATAITMKTATRLNWLPHETILFDGAALDRRVTIEMEENARFLGLEATIFGREASGESIRNIAFREEWHVRRAGKLAHADIINFEETLPTSKATLANARAIATLLLIDPNAVTHIDAVRAKIGVHGGASAWNGKLVARLLAKDGFQLKKAIISVLAVLARPDELPKNWTA